MVPDCFELGTGGVSPSVDVLTMTLAERREYEAWVQELQIGFDPNESSPSGEDWPFSVPPLAELRAQAGERLEFYLDTGGRTECELACVWPDDAPTVAPTHRAIADWEMIEF